MEIKICSGCHGAGQITVSVHHNGSHSEICNKCNGTGKMLTISREVSISVPYNEGLLASFYSFSHDIDSEIIDCGRRIEKISQKYNE